MYKLNKKELSVLIKKGCTRKEIAEICGCTTQAVGWYMRKHFKEFVKSTKTKKKVVCKNCKSKFETYSQKYCSKECYFKRPGIVTTEKIEGETQREHNRRRARNRYRKSKKHRDYLKRYQKKYAKKNLHKTNARSLLNYHIQKGKLYKPDTCEKCNKKASRIEGHHTDYSKPLLVMWLCTPCHHKQHKQESLHDKM